jgi:host factor-I protein
MFRSITADIKRSPRGNGNGYGRQQRTAPPESTNAENFYYLKQMNAKTPMVIIMTDGEEIRGWIEWYDRNCLKINRDGKPNLLIQKKCVKYMFKQDEL